jgi:hypothetical protein
VSSFRNAMAFAFFCMQLADFNVILACDSLFGDREERLKHSASLSRRVWKMSEKFLRPDFGNHDSHDGGSVYVYFRCEHNMMSCQILRSGPDPGNGVWSVPLSSAQPFASFVAAVRRNSSVRLHAGSACATRLIIAKDLLRCRTIPGFCPKSTSGARVVDPVRSSHRQL